MIKTKTTANINGKKSTLQNLFKNIKKNLEKKNSRTVAYMSCNAHSLKCNIPNIIENYKN